MSQPFLLSIDQGTTNSRAHIFTTQGELLYSHQISLAQQFPKAGWVEQDPEAIWQNTVTCCQEALKVSGLSAKQIAAVGITNQRETTIMWDKTTGKPIYPAINWQDRRTADQCSKNSWHINLDHLQKKTGLLLDPYFSASKIVWLLDHVPHARERAERGDLLFGTIDTFLLWRLTKGKVHATDATNASRTLLFNIETQQWDEELLAAFNIPAAILPVVLDSAADYGQMDATLLGAEIPIASMVGDQQAALIGQACFSSGMMKSTYGTGCFVLLNTGSELVYSSNKLLSVVAYRLQGEVTYGLEGSIFSAGTIIKWLRDHLNLIKTSAETETIAQQLTDTGGVYLVPAFTGLGAPYWDPYARAAILGLTSSSSASHIVRAGLEAVAYQTNDLLSSMNADYKRDFISLRVDGGMAANNWLLQFIADILNVAICRPTCIETTALGAAFLAGLQVGIYQSLDDIAKIWPLNREYQPTMDPHKREQLYNGWKAAIQKVLA